MKKIISTVLFLFSFSLIIAQSNISINIPDDLIQLMINYHDDASISVIIDKIKKILGDDCFGKNNIYPDKEYITSLLIDLDSDKVMEIIVIIGNKQNYPLMLVCKQYDNKYKIIYYENYYIKYEYPEIRILNVKSTSKVIYIKKTKGHGSGILQSTYEFYKIVNGVFQACGSVLAESYIIGWGKLINQECFTEISCNNIYSDEIYVTYNYNFFPGPINEDDASWEGHIGVKLIENRETIIYKWNETKSLYEPCFFTGYNTLNNEKIDCIRNIGDDNEILTIFKNDFDELNNDGNTEAVNFFNRISSLINPHP